MTAVVKTCLMQILHGIKDSLLGVVLLPYIDRQIEQQHAERWKRLQESLAGREKSAASQRRLLNRIEREFFYCF